MSDDLIKEEIVVSVRELVGFILRSGDIDNTGGGPSGVEVMLEGSRIHRKLQKAGGAEYMAEVPLKTSIPFDKYIITVEGRADGIIKGSEKSGPVIEEIKGTYRNIEKMKEPVPVHLAQAKCYACMYLRSGAEESGVDICRRIGVRMTYANLDTELIRSFEEGFTAEEIFAWFDDLIMQYKRWADLQTEWKEIRQKSIKNTQFPFEYRKGQKNLAVSVYQTLYEKKKLYLEAPTGCGKTMSVVFPSVKAVGERLADKIFYLTAKTITRTAPEEAFDILRSEGLQFKTVTLTAKEKICILEKPDCNPIGCAYAKGHYDRVNDALYALVTESDSLSREKIFEYAARFKVCPFELSLDASLFADGVICDYNYLFDPHARLRRFFDGTNPDEFIFLIDEAHNLPSRAREMYSAVLSEKDLKSFRNLIKASLGGPAGSIFLKKEYSGKMVSRIGSVLSKLKAVRERFGVNTVIAGFDEDWFKYETGLEELVRSLERLHTVMSDYLEEREKPGEIAHVLRDRILDIYFGISDFLTVFEDMGNDYVIYDTADEENGYNVHLFCTDPRRKISENLGLGRASVLFSATMLPVQYYKGLLGGTEKDYEVYAESVFDPKRRGIFIASDVTTRYRDRSEDLYVRTADHISRIIRPKKGNYMVFFPSYAYMHKVCGIYEEAFLAPGDEIMVQQESMTEEDKEAFLAGFEENRDNDGALIGFCVMGGIFSEGIDLKGDSLIGAICVGPGIPGVDLEHDILREYYDAGDRTGYEYAYMYPGMNKVLQAAGRVIRTEEDKGIIVLLDSRFLSSGYRKLFPREWTNVKVTDLAHIRNDIEDFWNEE